MKVALLGRIPPCKQTPSPKARFGLEEYLAHAAEVKAVQKQNLLKTVSLRVSNGLVVYLHLPGKPN